MILLTVDLNSFTIYDCSRYDNEKERRKLIVKAKNDARNNPCADVRFVDMVPKDIIVGNVEGQ